MTTFLLLLKCFFQSILSTLLRVVLPSVTILLLKYSFKILFTPLVPPKLHLTRISQTINYASVDTKNEHAAALKV